MSQAYDLENGHGDMHSAFYPDRIVVDSGVHGKSKTRQEFTEECDINGIMARAEASGVWPFKEPGDPVYYDFSVVPTDLQSAMETMINAENAFMSLPALVRKEFDNDPTRFVEYAADKANIERMRTWGLAEPEKAPAAPIEVRVIPDAAAPPTAPAAT